MKNLVDAFLALSWPWILLIHAVALFFLITVIEIAYRTGWKCCERKRELKDRERSFNQVTERI